MKEMLRRSCRTFFQAAVGFLSANIVAVCSAENLADFDYLKSALMGLLISSVAAGLSAIMNLPK